MYLKILAFAFVLSACQPQAPPPPEPPPDVTDPEPPPPEPPPDGLPKPRQPEEYYPLDRVQEIRRELFINLQANAWQGWRDLIYVMEHCPWSLEPNAKAVFPITLDEMKAASVEGATLDREGFEFYNRLPLVNVRCNPAHPEHDVRFCGRSGVLRKRLFAFNERLRAHLELASSLRAALIGQPGYGTYDSLKGWCQYMSRNQ